MTELLTETYPVRLTPTLRRQLETMAAADERKAAFVVRRLIKGAWTRHEHQRATDEQSQVAGEVRDG